ncbi:hypothetical protein SAMN02910298_00258 [Pseudobutyrivibrio sp. YE44]|uniref:hypothetical protein n=1 Tax=Pseudobutyrivibrio sp. YE44 TaxID=1520802 RepID=UPI0008825E9C|nr:hypothetical protein [Pseudobutyrivibrio sp. YE44]SDB07633.1 hypothetical protein SAMN02910298_00258 [Pseudobutyrivibrio sp. YE44]
MNILDTTSEELIKILSNGYKGDDYIITSEDVKLPIYIENNLVKEFKKLDDAGLLNFDGKIDITGGWEVSLRPTIFTYFTDKENYSVNNTTSINNFYASCTGVQIQQGVVNSSQEQTVTQGFDYDAITDIVLQIKKYDSLFDAEFGNEAENLRKSIVELEELIKNKENPSLIKKALGGIKDIAVGVGKGVITTGITSLIIGVL